MAVKQKFSFFVIFPAKPSRAIKLTGKHFHFPITVDKYSKRSNYRLR